MCTGAGAQEQEHHWSGHTQSVLHAGRNWKPARIPFACWSNIASMSTAVSVRNQPTTAFMFVAIRKPSLAKDTMIETKPTRKPIAWKEHYCKEHRDTVLICERCKAVARLAKSPVKTREEFAAMGRKSRRPPTKMSTAILRVMGNYNVSSATARRMIKKHGDILDQCALCHHHFSEHINGKCPRKRVLKVPSARINSSAVSSTSVLKPNEQGPQSLPVNLT